MRAVQHYIYLTFAMFLLVPVVYVTSCNSSTSDKVEENVDSLAGNIEEKVDELQEDYEEYRDEQFVAEAVEVNAAELHLLSLAKQKAANPALKANAAKMEADHQKLDNTLRNYAGIKNYQYKVDNSDIDNRLDRKDAGNDWDEALADELVDEHGKLIRKFERAENKITDPELKEIVRNTLPLLREHLNMAKNTRDKVKQ